MNRAERKQVHLQVKFGAVPIRTRLHLLFGGTLHLLIRKTPDGLKVLGVRATK